MPKLNYSYSYTFKLSRSICCSRALHFFLSVNAFSTLSLSPPPSLFHSALFSLFLSHCYLWLHSLSPSPVLPLSIYSLSSALSQLFIMLISPLLCSSRSDTVISLAGPNWIKCFAFFLPKHRFYSEGERTSWFGPRLVFLNYLSPITVYMTHRRTNLEAERSIFFQFCI